MKKLIFALTIIGTMSSFAGGIYKFVVKGSVEKSPVETLQEAITLCEVDNYGALMNDIVLKARYVKTSNGQSTKIYDAQIECGNH